MNKMNVLCWRKKFKSAMGHLFYWQSCYRVIILIYVVFLASYVTYYCRLLQKISISVFK